MTPSPAAFDRLRQRIQALRAKTVANGCTEGEALAAAAKVAELLDRYDLSLTDVEIRRSSCEQLVYQVRRNKRIPLDECIGVIADFCDCRVWREKDRSGDVRWVFFGLRADIEAAHCLAEMIDSTVRTELGRYKTSVAYQAFRHQERHVANASFTLGMLASIADKLAAMKAARESAHRGGRAIVVAKQAVVDAEIEKLGLELRTLPHTSRMVSPLAYEAGEVAGETLAIDAGELDRERKGA
ncbi:MAG: DUF2786 domain-containing protein [Reyranellaceae bacterium]